MFGLEIRMENIRANDKESFLRRSKIFIIKYKSIVNVSMESNDRNKSNFIDELLY